MRVTKFLWLAIPFVFLLAILGTIFGPGRKLQPEVKVQVIAVKADPDDPADVERARKKIEEAYEFLENGVEFDKVVAAKSEALSANTQGEMGWIGKGVLPKDLEDVVFSLEPGHHSEILKGFAGEALVYRILYVEERRNF
jgi:parvulin-like peptidyl-prolyl isomerase